MKKLVLFVMSVVLWTLLVWPFNHWDMRAQGFFIGGLVALIVVLVMREFPSTDASRWLNPRRYFWAVTYIFVLAYYIIKANLDVVYRVLHPDMPIRPGIIKIKTNLKTATGVTALANSITLTPGTLTVHATEDGYIYVHWIFMRTQDSEEAAKHITQKLEWFITRIFE